MYTDARTIFSTAQSLIGTDETIVSTNVVDLGSSPTLRSLGMQDCFMQLSTGTAMVSDLGTVEIQIVSDSTTALSSPTVHWTSGALDASSPLLAAGRMIDSVPLPAGARYERYLGLRYIAVSEITAGTIYAHITNSPAIRTAYPDAI